MEHYRPAHGEESLFIKSYCLNNGSKGYKVRIATSEKTYTDVHCMTEFHAREIYRVINNGMIDVETVIC